ncbi:glycerol-3-phosphate dehydrogenase, partial [Lactobacillus sp. XV13L]|nr:glycerol-3-phosphate dehydrogenase [Lactobacillus sp. XV13L]
LNIQHTNQRYMGDYQYPSALTATTSLAQALKGVEVVLFTVPTPAIRSVAQQVVPILKTQKLQPLIIHASKGLEQKTHLRISEILTLVMPFDCRRAIVALSGPSHAEEVAKKDITLITAASQNLAAAQY